MKLHRFPLASSVCVCIYECACIYVCVCIRICVCMNVLACVCIRARVCKLQNRMKNVACVLGMITASISSPSQAALYQPLVSWEETVSIYSYLSTFSRGLANERGTSDAVLHLYLTGQINTDCLNSFLIIRFKLKVLTCTLRYKCVFKNYVEKSLILHLLPQRMVNAFKGLSFLHNQ